MRCPQCGRRGWWHRCPHRRAPLKRTRGILALAGLGVALLAVPLTHTWHTTDVTLPTLDPSPGAKIYDAEGHLILQLNSQDGGHPVPLTAIAPALPTALIAIEDHGFYHNHGFDLKSLVRAFWVDLTHRAPVEGASTITEQLAKNLYLSDQKSLGRKWQEFWLGLSLADHYTKAQILDTYLNRVYFGHGAYGIAEASRIYFDTSPRRLTLPEATLLAGLPQAPSRYDPWLHWSLARARQREVLDAMVKYHDLTPAEAARVWQSPLHLRHPAFNPGNRYPDPWYVDLVINDLLAHGFTVQELYHQPLKIYTALRPRVYAIANRSVDQMMTRDFGPARHAYADHQAAVVVENPTNGHIWAVIGGRRHLAYEESNLALSAWRSTGSAIKPLLDYAPALARGYTPLSVLQDVPTYRAVNGQSWWPANDDFLYRGYLTLEDALAISDNNVAVHLLNRIGIPYAAQFVRTRFGLQLPPHFRQSGLQAALGIDQNVWNMTLAYGALANQGVRLSPILVTRVVKGHRVIYRDPQHAVRALTPAEAYVLTQMLTRVLDPHPLTGIGPGAWPTGHALGIGRPAAGKTGTSTEEADAWFIGYEPQMVVGVWEGNRLGEWAQPYTETNQGPAYGATVAGPIWREIMIDVNRTLALRAEPFPRPAGVRWVAGVSRTSGMLKGPYCPASEVAGAWMVTQTAPQHIGHSHVLVRVPLDHPNQEWQPGCGPYIIRVALRPEPDWHPGVPKPWDARNWPPTTLCRPSLKVR